MNPKPHLLIALLTLGAFLGTGIFIRVNIADITEMGDAVRFQYRANHVLLLMAGLLHLLLWRTNQAQLGWSFGRRIGSIFAIASVPILLVAFFVEPPKGIPERHITSAGVIILTIGVVFSALPTRRNKRNVE